MRRTRTKVRAPRFRRRPRSLAVSDAAPHLSLFTQARRVAAATAIQRAYRAWRSRWDTLVYIHVKCAATAEADRIYRAALSDELLLINVNLKWIEVNNMRMGPTSRFVKAARDHAGPRTFLVIGSHGYARMPVPPFLLRVADARADCSAARASL